MEQGGDQPEWKTKAMLRSMSFRSIVALGIGVCLNAPAAAQALADSPPVDPPETLQETMVQAPVPASPESLGYEMATRLLPSRGEESAPSPEFSGWRSGSHQIALDWEVDRTPHFPNALFLRVRVTGVLIQRAIARVNGGAWATLINQSGPTIANDQNALLMLRLESHDFSGVDQIRIDLQCETADGCLLVPMSYTMTRRVHPSEQLAEEPASYEIIDLTPASDDAPPTEQSDAQSERIPSTEDVDEEAELPGTFGGTGAHSGGGTTSGGGVTVLGSTGGGGGGGSSFGGGQSGGGGGGGGAGSDGAGGIGVASSPFTGSSGAEPAEAPIVYPAPSSGSNEFNAPTYEVYGRVFGSVIVISGVDAVSWATGSEIDVLFGAATVGDLAVPPKSSALYLELTPFLGGLLYSAVPEVARIDPNSYVVLRATPGVVRLRLWTRAENSLSPSRQHVYWDAAVTETYDPAITLD